MVRFAHADQSAWSWWLQLVTTLEQSISAATGGAVKVVITRYVSGSVVVTTDVLFLDGDVSDAMTYASLASATPLQSFMEQALDQSLLSQSLSHPWRL